MHGKEGGDIKHKDPIKDWIEAVECLVSKPIVGKVSE
jgi:hypothetical protein